MRENLEIAQGPGEVASGLEPMVPFFGEEAERFRRRLDWSYEQAGLHGRQALEGLAQSLPLKTGAEKIVYELGRGKVLSLLTPYSPHTANKDYSPDALKRMFYQRKLLHLLVPDCVPDIHMAGTSPPLLVLEQVERPGGKSEFIKAIDLRKQKIKNGKSPQAALFALGVGIDPTGDNNILDKNGNTMYVDNPIWTMDKDVLRGAIAGLPGLKQRKALKYIDRLESLGAEFVEAEEKAVEIELAA